MKKLLAVTLVGIISAEAFAEAAYITNVVSRQRWPWSQKVDIDFTVGGTEKCDVDITATWDGQATPVSLAVSGQVMSLAGGDHHAVWDPVAAGITTSLAGFRVTVTKADPADRQYLVVDLTTGEKTFYAEPPSGGFNIDAYKTSKLVMRRITASPVTFTMGYSSEIMTAASEINARSSAHPVTLTDDYYIGIFPVTYDQYSYVATGAAYTGNKGKRPAGVEEGISYVEIRGSTNATDNINWPSTGYAVSSNSWIAKMRALCGGGDLFDLPTEAQWEYAARCGTDTLFWNGGTAEDITSDAWTTYLGYTKTQYQRWVDYVGQDGWGTANTFGIYHTSGGVEEWCLDQVANSVLPSATNPVGVTGASGNCAVRGGGWNNDNIKFVAPASRWGTNIYTKQYQYQYCGFRLCLHTRNLFE